MTRDDEIEARAWALYTHQQNPAYGMKECLEAAQYAVEDRDRWRSSRAASAPEKTTPTPRIEDLAEELSEKIAGRLFYGYAVLGKLNRGETEARVLMSRKHVEDLIFDAIRAHAATLKAQQAKEGSDGA